MSCRVWLHAYRPPIPRAAKGSREGSMIHEERRKATAGDAPGTGPIRPRPSTRRGTPIFRDCLRPRTSRRDRLFVGPGAGSAAEARRAGRDARRRASGGGESQASPDGRDAGTRHWPDRLLAEATSNADGFFGPRASGTKRAHRRALLPVRHASGPCAGRDLRNHAVGSAVPDAARPAQAGRAGGGAGPDESRRARGRSRSRGLPPAVRGSGGPRGLPRREDAHGSEGTLCVPEVSGARPRRCQSP